MNVGAAKEIIAQCAAILKTQNLEASILAAVADILITVNNALPTQ